MKGLLKKLFPKWIKNLRMIYLTFGADIEKYEKSRKVREDTLKSEIIMICHILEKGLTMPQTKLGFGEERINRLCLLIEEYDKYGYEQKSFELNYALMILNNYVIFHKNQSHLLNTRLKEKIDRVVKYFDFHENLEQLRLSKEQFHSYSAASFQEFSMSRHTVRNYTDEVPTIDVLIEAIKLAQNAPSSCNRQPVRVIIITNKKLISQILDMQGGNRGFGHLASVLLVITTNNSYFSNIVERTQPSLNAGFFGMSLLYALHYMRIGAAILNWSQDKRKENKLNTILNIPLNEQIHFFVSCGYLPEEVKIAASVRRDVNSIYRIID